jgi:hypothetical protein
MEQGDWDMELLTGWYTLDRPDVDQPSRQGQEGNGKNDSRVHLNCCLLVFKEMSQDRRG